MSDIQEWKAYYFQPKGDIEEAPFVPRGMHRVSEVAETDSGSVQFRVVGSKRWHQLDMFVVCDMNAEW